MSTSIKSSSQFVVTAPPSEAPGDSQQINAPIRPAVTAISGARLTR